MEKETLYDVMVECDRRLDEQVEQMEAREEKRRKENGYDRLYDEFEVFLDRYNPFTSQFSKKKVFRAIFDEFLFGWWEEKYETKHLDFLVSCGSRVVGSYKGQSFTVNPKSGVLKWCNKESATKVMEFYQD